MCCYSSRYERPKYVQPFRDVVRIVPTTTVRPAYGHLGAVHTMLRERSGMGEILSDPIRLPG